MLQNNTFSPFRKPELSCLHALSFIFILALILFVSTTKVYSAQVKLAWNPNTEPDLAGHKIYSGDKKGKYDNVNDVGNQTSYTLLNLVEGQTYHIALTAYDTFNNESDYSEELVYTVPILDLTAPSTPTIFKASAISTSQINLTWNASTDNVKVTGYKIYRDGTQIATTTNSNYKDKGLSPSTTYSYTVSAYDAAGNESGQTPVSSATTSSLPVINPPELPPVNNPPVLSPVGNKFVNEGQALSFTISATDPDGDTLSYTTNNLPSGAIFNESTKTFDWTPTYSQTGTYSNITFQVSDGTNIDSGSITITVNNVNRAPALNPITDITIGEGSTVTLSPTATDPDGDALTYTYSGWMSSASYTTNYDDVGTHTVTVTVSDGSLSDSQVVTVIVLNGKNSAPVLDTMTDITVSEGVTITLSPTATDPDGDALTYTYSGWMSSASYTTNYDDAGTHTVTVTVSDGLLSDSQVVTIVVLNSKGAPVLDPITDITVNEGDTITLSPTATDPDGDALTYTYSGWMSSASYTTNYDDAGTHTVTVTVSDGSMSDSQVVTIMVNDTTSIVNNITTGDIDGNGQDDVIIDYGPDNGIWIRRNNDTEVKLIGISPEIITTGDMDGNGQDDVIIDFGDPYGIWIFMNNSTWVNLHDLSPEIITTGDMDGNGQDDVIIGFGDSGIWIFMNNSIWINLIGVLPEIITTGDMDGNGQDDVIIDFGDPYGIWIFMNNSTWVNLHDLSPEIITTGDMDGNGQDDVIIGFGDSGIWIFMNNSIWINLIGVLPEIITTGDIDGNGQDDVIIDFGDPYGIWTLMNFSTWVNLHDLSPEIITTGDMDGNGQDEAIIDFGGPDGIQIMMNNSTWSKVD